MKEPKDIKIPDQVKLADGIKKYQKCREKTKQHWKWSWFLLVLYLGLDIISRYFSSLASCIGIAVHGFQYIFFVGWLLIEDIQWSI